MSSRSWRKKAPEEVKQTGAELKPKGVTFFPVGNGKPWRVCVCVCVCVCVNYPGVF